MKRSPFAAVTATLAALFVLAGAVPALAHDALKSSSPAKDAKVKSLDEVRLEFTAKVRMPFVIVRGAGDDEVQVGKPKLDGSVVTQEVEESLPNGKYTIAYRVVSSDGHPIEGEIPFRLEGAEEKSPSPAPAVTESGAAAAQPQASASSPPSDRSSSPAADKASAAEDVTFPVWLIVVIGALAGIGIGFLLSARRKKP
ncbi:hypothetical protein SAMN05444920_105546 [Nonomuraea solani]|uniref:CopC domain-containing protein n=1 Tax=Nonomuraea solani TaxID=1144553 RepID=A0A1H6DK82_9ACTN|nr:copper resistance CopC family protein [Nonomuraea solani]SEG85521.1 hypothetical protein SAMN05444920_105546 [Nonomuraea solani]